METQRQYRLFLNACQTGKLGAAKLYHSLHNINTHQNEESAFRLACARGHLNIAQWLYSLGGVDIHLVMGNAFYRACENGKLDVVQWLHSLGGINIDTYGPEPFVVSCKNGHLDVAQWLRSHDCNWITNYNESETAFMIACQKNYLEMAQWMHSQYTFDIHMRGNTIFKSACIEGHIDIMKWLCSLEQFDACIFCAQSFSIGQNNIDMLQVLLENGVDIRAQNNYLLKVCAQWANKFDACTLLMPYCVEEDYAFLDDDIVRLLLNRPKNARKI